MVERAEISQVLAQIRSMQGEMARPARDVGASTQIGAERFTRPLEEPGFSELFSKAIDSVNQTQQQSTSLRDAYEVGTPGVSLTQVMVATEKASVAFQAMSQVRNKLVEAYKEVMNMPV